MKDKILYLVLGILIGAVITAGCFLIFSGNRNKQLGERGPRGEMENMVRGEAPEGMPEMPASSTQATDNTL